MSNQDNEKPVATNLAQPQQETPLSFIVLPGQNQLGQPVNPQPNQPMMAQPMQPMMGQPMMQQQNQPMMGQPMVQNQPIMYQYGQMQGQPVVQGQVQQMAYVQPQYIIHPNQQANVINIGDAQILVPGLGSCPQCKKGIMRTTTGINLVVFIILIFFFWPAALCVLCCGRMIYAKCQNCNFSTNQCPSMCETMT